jgi:tetratricopeptide (TPR) repeat protein
MGSRKRAVGERGRSPPRRSAARRRPQSERHPAADLRARWEQLHQGDKEPWPDERLIEGFARKCPAFASWLEASEGPAALAERLQRAWQEFHAGEFASAIEHGSRLGPLGASVANKAAAVHTLYAKSFGARELAMLEAALTRGEAAVELLPQYPNAHYLLALVLGRYSQRISIVRALTQGLAGRVRAHLERALELEPQHAEAYLAFGLYHAEIVAKLGVLAAALTYGASADAAVDCFKRALKLAPRSAIVHMEYANGLLLLDAARHREQARALYAQAAAIEPHDAMERLDVERARHGPG